MPGGLQLPTRSVPAVLAAAAISLRLTSVESLASTDVLGTKVWLDTHLFNSTLRTSKVEDGSRVWLMSEEKARQQGLEPWPPEALPTLCFLGLGPNSIEYLHALAQLFPELQLVLMEVQDAQWVERVAEYLGESSWRVAVAQLEEFAEAAGPARRSCDAISWSADTPPFSFYRYRELFYSSPYVLALFNMQGCTPETRNGDADKYYCEYLYSNFQSTLCGRVGDDRSAEFRGESLYFPLVEAKCGENICMCHAHSDAFLDFHFEQLCRKNEEHRFMGQWGQDRFLLENVFRLDQKRGQGLYVDVGASHPFHLSNTAYFDNCLEWRGICMEPNPRSKPILSALRTCEVVSQCAWANTTTFRFANGAELAAMTDDDTLLPSTPYEMPGGLDMGDTYFEAKCAPLHDLLIQSIPQAVGQEGLEALRNGRIPPIDLLSVDAEGAEVEIFRDFPFDFWHIRCIIVETSRSTSMAIDSLLLTQGFLKVAVLGKDAVYIHHSMSPSLPQTGQVLPQRIHWNEPGSDEDTIEYVRFQRLFGPEGDLDVDVGDQRLLNETELARQAARQEGKDAVAKAELVVQAQGAAVGGIFGEKRKQVMESQWVQEYLKEPKVKAALKLLLSDMSAFTQYVEKDLTLKAKIGELVDAGVISSVGASILTRSKTP